MRYLAGFVLVPGVGVLTTAQIDQEIGRLEEQRYDIKLAGPRAGVGITAIRVPGGAFMIGADAAIRSIETKLLCPSYDPICGEPKAGSKAMTAVGVAVLVGGIVGVILTSASASIGSSLLRPGPPVGQEQQSDERQGSRNRRIRRPVKASPKQK
jgi:hypothetical protein